MAVSLRCRAGGRARLLGCRRRNLVSEAARQWLEPGPLPAELLVPYPAEEMTAWRVADDAKNSRIEPHPGWRSRSRSCQ